MLPPSAGQSIVLQGSSLEPCDVVVVESVVMVVDIVVVDIVVVITVVASLVVVVSAAHSVSSTLRHRPAVSEVAT